MADEELCVKKILVIFDCFGVLCDKVIVQFIEKHARDKDVKFINETIVKPADLGLISRKEFFKRLSRVLGIDEDCLAFELEKLVIPHRELYPIIEKLKAVADVALLSNALEGHAEKVLEKFDIYHLFDKVFLSYKYKMVKPNLDFYKLCVDSFGKSYDEIYMVDDTDQNLEHISEIGIIPIKYVSAESVMNAFDFLRAI
ncbi:MAG: hypothetical protein E7612_10270 [Ruminococcaceae bacterium]|nr:hypothetical protein [Oscillospiraceae bacterium]